MVLYSNPDLAENAKQGLNKLLADEVPIEIKPVNPPDLYRRLAMEPKKLFWVRARGHIGKMELVFVCAVHAEFNVRCCHQASCKGNCEGG